MSPVAASAMRRSWLRRPRHPARGPSVAFVCGRIPCYRVPFFEGLRERLADEGVHLRVLAGRAAAREVSKADDCFLPWAEQIEPRALRVGQRHVVWQPVLGRIWGCDLVVLEQASRYVVNIPLLALQRVGGPSVAFWGHGFNHGPSASGLGEWAKRVMTTRPLWWFAYTEGVARSVAQLGFERERITVIQNSTDSEALGRERTAVTDAEARAARAELGVSGSNVALFVGSLYAEKRVEFLICAAQRARSSVPDLELAIVGNGPDESLVRAGAARHAWIHWSGHRVGHSLAAIAASAKIMVMPGRVGLVAVDAFALGLPVLTTSYPWQVPEIEYVRDGGNGVIVEDWQSVDAYAAELARVLSREHDRQLLVDGCSTSARRLTLTAMIDRVARGVAAALEARSPAGEASRREVS